MGDRKAPQILDGEDLDMAVGGTKDGGGGIGKGIIMEGMEDPGGDAERIARGEQRQKAIVIDRGT